MMLMIGQIAGGAGRDHPKVPAESYDAAYVYRAEALIYLQNKKTKRLVCNVWSGHWRSMTASTISSKGCAGNPL